MPVRLATHADLPAAVEQLLAAPRLALDTEFHAERRYRPQLLLVQVHVEGGDTWLFDPLEPGAMAEVAPALRSRPWVLHSGSQDLRLLHDILGGLPERVLDTQIAAGLVTDVYPSPLGAVIERTVGVVLDKSQTLSDWARRPLRAEQLDYAAKDVTLLPAAWDHMAADAEALGRIDAITACCDEARAAALGAPWVVRGEPWRELHGAPTLSPDALAVLVALHGWRERVADEENQPARSILGDALLLELSRRRPTDLAAISADRRLSRSVARQRGEAILACIAEGLASQQRPLLVARHTPAWRRAAWLELFADALAVQRRFSARLVLPRSLVERAVLLGLSSRDDVAALLGSWRDALIGDALWAAWRGEIHLGLGAVEVVPESFSDEKHALAPAKLKM